MRQFATDGVPLEVLLHQRMYGGAFRQVLDATSSMRGDSQLGWARAADALGPVIRDCDGRVFTRATLTDMFEVDPFPGLAGRGKVTGE